MAVAAVITSVSDEPLLKKDSSDFTFMALDRLLAPRATHIRSNVVHKNDAIDRYNRYSTHSDTRRVTSVSPKALLIRPKRREKQGPTAPAATEHV